MKKYPMFYGGKEQVYPNVKPGAPFFSKSARVGNLLFLSGSARRTLETGDVPSDIFEEQMNVAFDKVKLALSEAGSSLEHIVKTLILIRDQEHFPILWKTLLEYYQKNAPILTEEPPAATAIRVDSMAKRHYLVEIDAIAVVSKNQPDWELKKYPLYRNGLKQVYPNIKPGMPFCSESVRVGNLIFLSGVTGEDPDSGKVMSNILEDQMKVAHDKIRTAMEKTGSALSNVIETFHYMPTMDLEAPEIKDEQGGSSPGHSQVVESGAGVF